MLTLSNIECRQLTPRQLCSIAYAVLATIRRLPESLHQSPSTSANATRRNTIWLGFKSKVETESRRSLVYVIQLFLATNSSVWNHRIQSRTLRQLLAHDGPHIKKMV